MSHQVIDEFIASGIVVEVHKNWDSNAENPRLWLCLQPESDFDDSRIAMRLTRDVANRIVEALNKALISECDRGAYCPHCLSNLHVETAAR